THPHNLSEAHTFDPFQFLQDIDVGKVIDEAFIGRWVVTEYIEVHQHTVHLFFSGYPRFNYFFRQFIKNRGYPVLYVYSGNIWIRTYSEKNLYQGVAVVGGN